MRSVSDHEAVTCRVRPMADGGTGTRGGGRAGPGEGSASETEAGRGGRRKSRALSCQLRRKRFQEQRTGLLGVPRISARLACLELPSNWLAVSGYDARICPHAWLLLHPSCYTVDNKAWRNCVRFLVTLVGCVSAA